MTATPLAQGTSLKCDAPRCNKPATVDFEAWSWCAEHANTKVASTPARATPPRPAPPVAVASTSNLGNATGGNPIVTNAPPTPGPTGLLLEQASGHSNARVRKAADRIETQLEQLRALIAGLADDERRKKTAAAAKEKARADIERLEQQLAAAKAALRKKPTGTTALPCRKGCGRTSTSPAGRAAHERHCEATGD